MIEKIKQYKYYFLLTIFTFIFAFLIDENGPLYNFSNYADVCVFYEIGKMIINGCEMYVDFADIKGPYMYFIGAFSFLFNKSFIAFFILDLISFLTFSIFSFKSFNLYLNENKSFIYTLLSLFGSIFFIKNLGNPETIFIGIFSYFLYWILSGGLYNKDNKRTFFIFGIVFSFIFLTKCIYLIPFGLIAILYLFFNKKDIKRIFKEVLFFIIGILVGAIPLFIYELKNNCLGEIIFRYLNAALKYSEQTCFNESIDIVFYLIIPVVFILGFILSLYINSSKKEFFISAFYFLGCFISIVVSRRYYFYYSYFIITFIPFIFIFIESIESKRKKIVLNILLLIISICILFNLPDKLGNKGFGLSIEDDYQYLFYEDFKDEINEDTIILNLFSVDTLITKYFDYQPSYKYFNLFNNYYKTFKDVFDANLNLIKNKEVDIISIRFFEDIDEDGEICETVIASYGLYGEDSYYSEIVEALQKNYTLSKTYDVKGFKNSDKNYFVKIYTKK